MVSLVHRSRKRIRQVLNRHVHFLELHYLYIATIILIFSGLYYAEPGTTWNYIDALYMATTGSTNTGTNTIAISTMSAYQVSVLFFSSFFGSHIVVSFVVVMVRKHYFSKRFKEVVLFNKARKARELHRRRQNSKSQITVVLQNGSRNKDNSNDGSHSNIEKEFDSQVSQCSFPDAENSVGRGDIIGAFPLTMSLEEQHRQQIKQLRQDSRMLPKSAAKSVIYSFHQQEDQHPDQQRQEDTKHNLTCIATSTQQANDTVESVTTNGLSSLSVSSPISVAANHGPSGGGQNIIFADNILQQRESARQRLEAQRQLEEGRHHTEHPRPPASQLGMNSRQQSFHSVYDLQDLTDGTDVLSLAQDQMELTKEQRYLIGGAEYRALDLLAVVIPLYYIGIVIGAAFAFRIFIAVSPYAQEVLLTTNGPNKPIDPWYLSFFVSLSAMNNLGLSQIDASMVPFQNTPFPLILLGFLILAGNTAYPIFLRFSLWCMYHLTPESYTMLRETLRYLLDHPRRCYTTLFPSRQTWWLLAILIAINLTEMIVYVSTNFWLPVMDGIPIASQIMDALFQGIATRNAGFAVVNLSMLNPGTILVYIVAMYIGVYPVAISMRNSNVYQERSLGMYRTDYDDNASADGYNDDDGGLDNGGFILKLRTSRTMNSVMTTSKKVFRRPDFFVMTQIQRQLTKDICWVVVGIFCVCVLEAQAIMSPSPVTIATVMFECVSAFGCVGGSIGGSVPGTSQSVDYRTVSKLVIIMLMYRGRHRGLPAAIDRAVLLPSEQLERSDTEEQQLSRLHRSASFMTTANGFSNTYPANIRVYHRSETL